MKALVNHAHPVDEAAGLQLLSGGSNTSVRAFVRQWGPYVLTALLVPGGIAVTLLLLLRRWNQRRAALQRLARA